MIAAHDHDDKQTTSIIIKDTFVFQSKSNMGNSEITVKKDNRLNMLVLINDPFSSSNKP